MSLIISLTFIIVVSFLFGRIAEKFHFSKVIGLIFAGLVLANPFFKELITPESKIIISNLSVLGLFSLMFLAGLEVSWRMLLKEKKDAVVVTFFTITTSLTLGFLVFRLMGFNPESALIMGICFGITAEATKARVLFQLNKLKTKIGSLLMGSGIINDIIGVISLVVITYIFTENFSWGEFKVLIGIIIFFILGIIVHYIFNRYSNQIKIIEKIFLFIIVPFFFVNMGMNFSFNSLTVNIKVMLAVIITASLSQILGVFLTKPITKFNYRQLYLIGWGMNSKGAVELAIAFIAMEIGLLPVSLYSALIISALFSTIMFQIIIFKMVQKYPKIMN